MSRSLCKSNNNHYDNNHYINNNHSNVHRYKILGWNKLNLGSQLLNFHPCHNFQPNLNHPPHNKLVKDLNNIANVNLKRLHQQKLRSQCPLASKERSLNINLSISLNLNLSKELSTNLNLSIEPSINLNLSKELSINLNLSIKPSINLNLSTNLYNTDKNKGA